MPIMLGGRTWRPRWQELNDTPSQDWSDADAQLYGEQGRGARMRLWAPGAPPAESLSMAPATMSRLKFMDVPRPAEPLGGAGQASVPIEIGPQPLRFQPSALERMGDFSPGQVAMNAEGNDRIRFGFASPAAKARENTLYNRSMEPARLEMPLRIAETTGRFKMLGDIGQGRDAAEAQARAHVAGIGAMTAGQERMKEMEVAANRDIAENTNLFRSADVAGQNRTARDVAGIEAGSRERVAGTAGQSTLAVAKEETARTLLNSAVSLARASGMEPFVVDPSGQWVGIINPDGKYDWKRKKESSELMQAFALGQGKDPSKLKADEVDTSMLPEFQGYGRPALKRQPKAGPEAATGGGASAAPAAGGGTLDQAKAAALLKSVGGDKAKARQLAKELGFTF
jgi:hypothetical protein